MMVYSHIILTPGKKFKRLIFLILVLLLLLFLFYKSVFFLKIYANFLTDIRSFENVLIDGDLLKLKSKCGCRNQNVYVIKSSDKVYVQIGSSEKYYNFSEHELNTGKITCDLYNVFSRGPKQKVIGLSLYGTDPFYYNSIETIAKLVKKYYPDWLIRVYYDSSINETVICELECLQENNIDFCNINEIPFGSPTHAWNANHMHKMSWRWLPIGDEFVDYFMSRDTDSWITEREYDSVQVWLKSNKLFHIMRGIELINNFNFE